MKYRGLLNWCAEHSDDPLTPKILSMIGEKTFKDVMFQSDVDWVKLSKIMNDLLHPLPDEFPSNVVRFPCPERSP